jgi:DNA-binding transcriptional MerR regulator
MYMNRSAENSPENKTIRDVMKEFDVADSTVREWIRKGVFGTPESIQKEKRRGKLVTVFTVAQIERLLRFHLYKKHFPEDGIGGVAELLDQVDDGDVTEMMRALTDIEQQMMDDLEEIQAELQTLHARLHGETIEPD